MNSLLQLKTFDVIFNVAHGQVHKFISWVYGMDRKICHEGHWSASRGEPVRGWSGGAMVLGKYSEPKRPTNLDNSRARVYCTCSRCGWGCLDIFFLSSIFSLFFLILWETVRYRLKYCLKGPLNPKQLTNQIQS